MGSIQSRFRNSKLKNICKYHWFWIFQVRFRQYISTYHLLLRIVKNFNLCDIYLLRSSVKYNQRTSHANNMPKIQNKFCTY